MVKINWSVIVLCLVVIVCLIGQGCPTPDASAPTPPTPVVSTPVITPPAPPSQTTLALGSENGGCPGCEDLTVDP